MKEKKVVFKQFVWAALLMNVIAVITAVVVSKLNKEYTYSYVNGAIEVDNGMRHFIIIGYVYAAIAAILLIIALVQVIRFRKEMSFVLNLVVVILMIPITLGMVRFSVKSIIKTDDGYDSACYEFSHEDKTIVICEKKSDNDSYAEVYQLVGEDELYFMDTLETLDGYTNNGQYTLSWSDYSVMVQYGVDGSGFEMSFELMFVK